MLHAPLPPSTEPELIECRVFEKESDTVSGSQIGALLELYALADKYRLPYLQDTVMNRVRAFNDEIGLMPLEHIDYIYRLAPPGSGLRKFVCFEMIWWIIKADLNNRDSGMLQALLARSVELGTDVMDALKGSSGKEAINANNLPDCDFFTHAKEGPCTLE